MIPVGQKFKYTKLMVPLYSLGKNVMTLEAHDNELDINRMN